MTENSTTEQNAPEIPAPAPSPAPHELAGPTKNSAQNSVGEKIRRAGGAVLEKFGFKKGRGRPKKCRGCDGGGCEGCNWTGFEPSISDTPVHDEPVEELPPMAAAVDHPPAAPASRPVDNSKNASLTRRAIASIVKGLLQFAKNIIRSKAVQAGIDDSFANQALRECEPDAEALADFQESLDLVCEKYNVSTEYAPELNLIAATGRLAAPFWTLNQTFAAEIRRRRQKEEGR